jgi:hypothetical protein
MQVSRKQRLFASVFLSILLLLSVLFFACESSDLGTCTILGVDEVIEDISLEDCQIQFGETPGATGWQWEPNN